MNIVYSRQAVKAIAEMDSVTKRRIKKGIDRLPAGDVVKLKGHEASFRLRIGDYRVLFEMSASEICISGILPRGEAYKK